MFTKPRLNVEKKKQERFLNKSVSFFNLAKTTDWLTGVRRRSFGSLVVKILITLVKEDFSPIVYDLPGILEDRDIFSDGVEQNEIVLIDLPDSNQESRRI